MSNSPSVSKNARKARRDQTSQLRALAAPTRRSFEGLNHRHHHAGSGAAFEDGRRDEAGPRSTDTPGRRWKARTTIPIVFISSGDLIGDGLVAALNGRAAMPRT